MGNAIDAFGSYSSIFSNNGNSLNTGLAGLATDYASLRSGSYKKLVSAYYKKTSSEETTTTKADKEKQDKKLQLVAGNASSLKSAAEALKKTDFSTASEEDALKVVKDFISAYNSVIDTADDVDNKGVLRNTVWMTDMMKKSAGLLSDIGIKVGSDNKLTLDEDKWKEAGTAVKKTLFSGYGSLADKLMYKASQITNAASTNNSKTASSYKSDGDYTKVTTDSMYDALV